MKLEVWKITGKHFHFGKRGMGQEESAVTMSSDSLFSAIVARLAVLENGDVVKAFMKPFSDGAPPFALTSTYPYAGEVKFFPVPSLSNALRKQEESNVRVKDLKKIKFISEEIFTAMIKSRGLTQFYKTGNFLQNQQVLFSNSKETSALPDNFGGFIWEEYQRPRVTIDRGDNSSTIFHSGQTVFADDCGLWFGIQWSDEAPLEHRTWLKNALADLSYAGLGGDRNSGFGAAKIERNEGEDLELDEPIIGEYWVNLSSYLPASEQEIQQAMFAEHASYSLKEIPGWLGSSTSPRALRRRSINMIAEGSVLGTIASEGNTGIPGQIEDIAPLDKDDKSLVGHSVYRSGYAVAVRLAERNS